ncbi:adenylyltransferase and sulfurtransferase MOCS3 isoform X2 [Spodoptera litura]|uniref:Adenylyltransferase and sulfurtransferase MOCS3 homolog n=1 Tax=Spodoptera litura TaxID=69820 RepID=A0A9J7EK36_SPOLT|nr:adenylyltransferase and sulfurtransferase MOCS3 isoform X2 [Spodoptera litura]
MEQLYTLEKEIKELRQKLREKEEEMTIIRRELFGGQGDFRAWIPGQGPLNTSATEAGAVQCGSLPKWAIERYSRQILLKDIGVFGQTRICEAKVLIVGAGGLGCPSAMYLAAAGVGEIGIIDYDVVELTNIHRQVLHFEQDENVSKAESAASTLRSINSRIKVTPYNLQLDSKNAMDIASQYDIILDCTDNVPTRYMLSDLSCFIKKPLISGSALKMEGQLTIYGYRSESHKDDKGATYRGPCYRCVFPTPPSPDVVGSCSAHGVAGPVPGVIGILQAMEALKIILDMSPDKLLVERMLIFDAEDMTTRTVRLRKRNPSCATCSDNPTVTQLVDYEAYCSAPANDKDLSLKILPQDNRITATEVSELIEKGSPFVIDVRASPEFQMCHILQTENRPIDGLRGSNLDKLVGQVEESQEAVIFICRRGNDSQIAAKLVLDRLPEAHRCKVKDMTGGLHAWAEQVDNNFPVY